MPNLNKEDEHTIPLSVSHRDLDILSQMFQSLGPPPPGSDPELAKAYLALLARVVAAHNTITAAGDTDRFTDGHADGKHRG